MSTHFHFFFSFYYSDAPKCLNPETQFLIVRRNVGTILVDCQVDSEPSVNVTYKWMLSSSQLSKSVEEVETKINDDDDDEFNEMSDIENNGHKKHHQISAMETIITVNDSSLLDVIIAVNQYFDDNHRHYNGHQFVHKDEYDDRDSNMNEPMMDSYSTLLLQCQAQNMIGKQKKPCTFMLHIHPGKHFIEKSIHAKFTARKFFFPNHDLIIFHQVHHKRYKAVCFDWTNQAIYLATMNRKLLLNVSRETMAAYHLHRRDNHSI